MVATESSELRASGERGVALIVYALLFVAPFFAGVPGLIGVVIAYARRAEVNRCVRKHHSFQIRMFWVAFALSLVIGISALWALINGAGDLFAFFQAGGWDRMMAGNVQFRDFGIGDSVVVLTFMALGLSLFVVAMLMLGSVLGFARLVSKPTPELLKP